MTLMRSGQPPKGNSISAMAATTYYYEFLKNKLLKKGL
jgi:hypothetical protein